MSPFLSDPLPRVVILANPTGDRRMGLIEAAVNRLGLPPVHLIPYSDYLAGRINLTTVLQPGDIFRIDSPGRDFEVERALLVRGADIEDEETDAYDRLSKNQVENLTFDKGLILPSRQWYLGYRDSLKAIAQEIKSIPNLSLMNAPDEITIMFDKRACHQKMAQAGVSVPAGLPPIESFDHLLAEMKANQTSRVFIKLAHGSSAAGAAAFQLAGHRMRAITTAEMVRENGAVRLYASRRIRTLFDPTEIKTLVNALCGHRLHVERWLPKASTADGVFDLRVVTIRDQAAHVVARVSKSPMTNLHLLNKRGDWDKIRQHIGEERWETMQSTCLAAKALFPKSLYAGVDLLVSPNFRKHAILEINAFGDLLPGITHQGQDTYTKELSILLAERNAQA